MFPELGPFGGWAYVPGWVRGLFATVQNPIVQSESRERPWPLALGGDL